MGARTVFAPLRGMAGALLGAYLSAGVFRVLYQVMRVSPLDLLAWVWVCLTLCPAARLGFWCFRGLRNWKFGYGTVWVCPVLALPLALRPASPESCLAAMVTGAFFAWISYWIGRDAFLRYLDPAWYRDPRRLAAWHGRGRNSGRWHISPPFGPEVPYSFDARWGSTILHVQGDSIRVEPHLGRGWTFSVQDVAGVIQAPGIGHCIPYNAQGQALAVFCLSHHYHNGELFGHYLRKRGVPFYRLNEVPKTGPLPVETGNSSKTPEPLPTKASPLGEALWEAVSEYAAELEEKERGQEEEIRHTDFSQIVAKDAKDFQLALRRTIPFGALIGGGLLLGLIVYFAGFPIIAIHNGPYVFLELRVLLAVVIVLMGGPWVFASVKGELFQPRLSVEDGHVWLNRDFWPLRELSPEDFGELRFDRSDECYILFDKNGRILLKFSTRDDGGPAFMNFLTDHNIRIRSEH